MSYSFIVKYATNIKYESPIYLKDKRKKLQKGKMTLKMGIITMIKDGGKGNFSTFAETKTQHKNQNFF